MVSGTLLAGGLPQWLHEVLDRWIKQVVLPPPMIGDNAMGNTVVAGKSHWPDPIACYSPEILVFPRLARDFASSGNLDPLAVYLILDWKAPRARTRHLKRLAKIANGSFDGAIKMIATSLREAPDAEQQLGLLLTTWGFRLPTASAILAVLYPDTFTIYDIRVCNMLGDFGGLGERRWSARVWQEYQRFVAAVRATAPKGLSLRNCDRWLWGQDKRETLLTELTESR